MSRGRGDRKAVDMGVSKQWGDLPGYFIGHGSFYCGQL